MAQDRPGIDHSFVTVIDRDHEQSNSTGPLVYNAADVPDVWTGQVGMNIDHAVIRGVDAVIGLEADFTFGLIYAVELDAAVEQARVPSVIFSVPPAPDVRPIDFL